METVAIPGTVDRQALASDTPRRVLDSCARLLRSACASYVAADEIPIDAEAVAWLTENSTYLRTCIRETREIMSRRYYRALQAVQTDSQLDEPEIRRTARQLIEQAEDGVDEQVVASHFERAQRERHLSLAELWAIAPMLRLSLLERLRDTLQKPEGLGSHAAAHEVRAAVTGLRAVDEVRWRELTESLSALHSVLAGDPAGVYPTMDFETRDSYRRAVERLARRSDSTEEEVGARAVELARVAVQQPATSGADDTRATHVGFYLVGPGRPSLERACGARKRRAGWVFTALMRWPAAFHIGGACALTVLLLAAAARWLVPAPWWMLALLALPASDAALAIVNAVAHLVVGPRRLPRLDLSDGVPADCRTLVVVPALLISEETIGTLLERLEVHYLSSRDPNIRFALLTDCSDSRDQTDDDQTLGERCAEGIRRLNERYAASGRPFYLFHRVRTWDPAEGVWMGHERKRGKLNALNTWLLGGPDAFSIKTGDLEALKGTRYVITLDADTRMPMDAARTLVATAAHPLNQPVFDTRTNLVREGYAILQPRVSVSAQSFERSRLARLRGGTAGVDPYATAVSDVYQDLYGRASFTGKGLYDLAAFDRALNGRFPDATLLSHDLIEGEHCGVGLVTDVEFVDDYPGSYEVYSKRKHRWARGDWQLLYWLLPRVPTASGTWAPNALSMLSRWKIFDNMRRTAGEIAVAAAIVVASILMPARATAVLLAAVALMLAPSYAEAALAALRLPPRRLLATYACEKAGDIARAHRDVLISLGLLLHQAALMNDAIVRTLVRRLVTHRRLLQWETTAQAESSAGSGVTLSNLYLGLTLFVAAALLFAAVRHGEAVPALVAVLWLAAPLVARWLNRPGRVEDRIRRADVPFVRGLALRTWRYFSESAGMTGLVPDNIQEGPDCVTHIASPTNIGLQLASTLAAHDFGYLTLGEFTATSTRVMDTVERLERYRGHLYNWYDTRTLEPLLPRYVSTVDSGNLCAALLTVKQGCEELRSRPILGADTIAGIRDHCVRLRNALPRRLRHRSAVRAVTSMLERLDDLPEDVFAWSRLLSELRVSAVAVHEWLRLSGSAQRGISEAADWASRLLGRLGAVSAELRRYAPWTEVAEHLVLPPAARRAAGAVPTLAACEAHYDSIEQAMTRARAEASFWQHASRLLIQVRRARDQACDADRALRQLGDRCHGVVEETDFAFLFDARRKLLHIGYTSDSNVLDASYYDLLASEARAAVFVAVAKRDIPAEAWFHLGRKLTSRDGERVLVSWGGTMFEQLMPALFMRPYADSLLDASMRATVRIQQAHARRHRVPWGFSEAAHAARDQAGRYQYRTFGVPGVAMRKMADGQVVVAPYATALAAMVTPREAVDNLRLMASRGWLGRFGFFESIDYSSKTGGRRRRGTVVRAFMAHHQGMTLVALVNVALRGRMQARFHADPLVAAASRLLQERIPTRLPADDLELDVDTGRALRERAPASRRQPASPLAAPPIARLWRAVAHRR